MNYGNQGSRGGGFGGFDPDQIFGPQGILNQVFGQGGQPPWGGGPGQRGGGPFGPGGPFGGPGRGPGPRGGQGRRARRGDVRNAILHVLLRESTDPELPGQMNGYQLMQQIAADSGGAWQPSSGAIYPALAQLEDEGLIEQVEVEGRKAYRLTDAGRDAAEDLPPQTWAGGEEPDDPWAAGGRAGRGERGRGERSAHARGRHDAWGGPGHREDGPGGARRQRGAQLWKALGSVAMATQAVSQAGDDALSREAGDLLDRTRRDLYRLLAEAEVARDEREDDAVAEQDGEITDAEIVED